MRFERNVTDRGLIISFAMQVVILIFSLIWAFLSHKVFPNTDEDLLTGVSCITILIVDVIVASIVLDIGKRYLCNFAYTINIEDDEVVITDDYGETKRIGKDFVIVGRLEYKYKILLREASKPGIIICYNRKVLEYLKEINPNCMGKRLKKIIEIPS